MPNAVEEPQPATRTALTESTAAKSHFAVTMFLAPFITIHPKRPYRAAGCEDDGLTRGYERGESAVIPLTHRVTATGRTITVGRARGSFKGFARRRSLEVRLPAAAPPKAVKVGGKTLAWHHRLGRQGWTYDGQAATVVIRLASIDVTRGATITVVRNPQTPDRLANGLAGLLRRLDRVCRYNNLASPVFPVHPGERDAVDVAQAGNRIGLDPTTFAAEVAGLREEARYRCFDFKTADREAPKVMWVARKSYE